MTGVTHPRHQLDSLLLHPVRLSVAAALAGVDRAEFALVRDRVEVSDSALSKQAALLEEAGYVEITKGRVARQARTWLRLTDDGASAYQGHLRALGAIASPSSTIHQPRHVASPSVP